MIALLLAAALADLPGSDAARFDACTALIRAEPARAIVEAEAWAARAKVVPAQQCLGLAYAAGERWAEATEAFAQAAVSAEAQRDGRAAFLWAQAGNAALAGDDAKRARAALDKALAMAALDDTQRGEAWLDRARADVALNDVSAGRADLDNALRLIAHDPFAWLLSATFARRQNDLPRAAKDIEEAAKLAQNDPAVALEAGNIAAASGVPRAAEVAWRRAAALGPDTAEGKAAVRALAASSSP